MTNSPTSSTSADLRRATLAEIENDPAWQSAFAHQRKDHRYYAIVEQTLNQGFQHYYFLMTGPDGQRAVQPFFVHDQDLLAGSGQWLQKTIAFFRRVFPRLLKLRTLMVGCAAGEGHLDATDETRSHWIAQQLADVLKTQARELRCPMVVMKEFHVEYRESLRCFDSAGFTRAPSLPMTLLNIQFADFDEFMSKTLSKATRKNLRRKFKVTREDAIAMEVITDITPHVDEIYPLYMAVYERSPLHFEKLTKEFFCRLGREMPDKVKYFLWRRQGKIVAFSLCMIHDGTLYDEYLGLDYSVALNLHLYFHTLRDAIEWGMHNGCRSYCSSALNYDPKLHLRCSLVPLDLHVAHTNGVFNFFLGKFLPLLEPTRNDKTLKQFANYADLWGKK